MEKTEKKKTDDRRQTTDDRRQRQTTDRQGVAATTRCPSRFFLAFWHPTTTAIGFHDGRVSCSGIHSRGTAEGAHMGPGLQSRRRVQAVQQTAPVWPCLRLCDAPGHQAMFRPSSRQGGTADGPW